MERKLGEIFTYNGKIYQVVKGFSCKGCAFIKNGCCDLVNELLGPCDYTKRTDKTNVIFKEINNMEIKNNQLTIDIPEGMEIDLENSDLAKGIVRFKQSTITYEDVEDTLKLDKNCKSIIINESNASKLVTLSRLMNIAKYYNGDWKPNWSDQNEYKYFIIYNGDIYKVDHNWTEIKEIEFWNNTEYRVKPEPKYRPFKDAKECWAEMQKHQPIGWTKLIGAIEYSFITDVDDNTNYSGAIKEYTFADGTPFGIREE